MDGPLAALLTGLAVTAFVAACAGPSAVRLGMSPEDVVRLLGEPDRRAVLVGKLLEDPREIPAEQAAGHRWVFIYETSGIQVWFLRGRVTGVTQNGVAVELASDPPKARGGPDS